jgi:hypothetical protein
LWSSKDDGIQNSNIKFNSRNKKVTSLTLEREMHAFKNEGRLNQQRKKTGKMIESQNTL